MEKPTYDAYVYEHNQQIAILHKQKRMQAGATIYLNDRNVPYKVVNVFVEGRRQIVDVVRE